MEQRDPRLREIWRQSKIPVIFRRPPPKRLAVRVPFNPANFNWLRGDRRHRPIWNCDQKYWETPVYWPILQIFEDFKKINSDECFLAFVRQYAFTEEPTPTNTQILGSYIGSYKGANIKLTHRWYDPSSPFSIQPDIHKARLEVAGHQPVEIGYQG